MATSRLNNNLQVPQKHLATFSLENPSSRQALSAFAVLNANGDLISAIGYLSTLLPSGAPASFTKSLMVAPGDSRPGSLPGRLGRH